MPTNPPPAKRERLTAEVTDMGDRVIEAHDCCHDVVCNGDRSKPRGKSGSGCSCRGRDDAYQRAEQAEASLAQAEQERDEARRLFQRSQERWGHLKSAVKQEIDSLSGFTGQQGAQYQNGIARLRWVIDQMQKSPDVLAEMLPKDASHG